MLAFSSSLTQHLPTPPSHTAPADPHPVTQHLPTPIKSLSTYQPATAAPPIEFMSACVCGVEGEEGWGVGGVGGWASAGKACAQKGTPAYTRLDTPALRRAARRTSALTLTAYERTHTDGGGRSAARTPPPYLVGHTAPDLPLATPPPPFLC